MSFPALAERLSAAFRVTRFFGTADLGACLRSGAGPGWALVGDAGYRVEALAASGIADAFLEAEWPAEALGATSEDWSAPGGALDAYQERRDACLLGPFNSVAGVSAHPGPLEVVPAVLALLQRTWADRLDVVRTLRV